MQLAATILFLLGLAHSLLGERYILQRLFRSDNLPRLFGGTTFTTQTLRFAWHVTTVLWWGFAVLLWQLASGESGESLVLKVVAYTSFAAGLLPLSPNERFITGRKRCIYDCGPMTCCSLGRT